MNINRIEILLIKRTFVFFNTELIYDYRNDLQHTFFNFTERNNSSQLRWCHCLFYIGWRDYLVACEGHCAFVLV